MKVLDVINRNPIVVNSNTKISYVLKLFELHSVSTIYIVKNQKLVGVTTLSYLKKRKYNPNKAISTKMLRKIEKIDPYVNLWEAKKLIGYNDSLAVIRNGKFYGIVSQKEIDDGIKKDMEEKFKNNQKKRSNYNEVKKSSQNTKPIKEKESTSTYFYEKHPFLSFILFIFIFLLLLYIIFVTLFLLFSFLYDPYNTIIMFFILDFTPILLFSIILLILFYKKNRNSKGFLYDYFGVTSSKKEEVIEESIQYDEEINEDEDEEEGEEEENGKSEYEDDDENEFIETENEEENDDDFFNFEMILDSFILQSHTNDLKRELYPKEYLNLKLKMSFGTKIPTNVSWIAFLNKNMDISNGIYPCFLYYKKAKILILSYGISEINVSGVNWPYKVTKSLSTISEFFGDTQEKYGNSYVFRAYNIDFDGTKINIYRDGIKISQKETLDDFNNILDVYLEIFQKQERYEEDYKENEEENDDDVFNFKMILDNFILQSYTNDLKTTRYPNKYLNLRLKLFFGMETLANISGIVFLGKNMEVSNGIYPCFIYYKKAKLLFLSYGISETNVSEVNWPYKVTKSLKTIAELFGYISKMYGNSYIFKVYNVDIDDTKINMYNKYGIKISSENIQEDLNEVLDIYLKILQEQEEIINEIKEESIMKEESNLIKEFSIDSNKIITEKEDKINFLKENYSILSIEEISRKTGWSKNTVRMYARNLGLKRVNDPSISNVSKDIKIENKVNKEIINKDLTHKEIEEKIREDWKDFGLTEREIQRLIDHEIEERKKKRRYY